MKQIAEKNVAFYTERIERLKVNRARLLDMYMKRALKNTPTSDALWAGYVCIGEELDRNALELAKWVEWVKNATAKADEVTA